MRFSSATQRDCCEQFDFAIEAKTTELIERHHHLVTGVAGERVRDELCRILAAPKGALSLRCLDQLGLLCAIMPELTVTKGVEQPKEHYWDVFDHSIETVTSIEGLLREREIDGKILEAVPWSPELEEHFNQEVSSGHSRKVLLKLAGLLHDIAKPQAKMVEQSGRIRFFGHGMEGAAMAEPILGRLRFSGQEVKMVCKMIEHHLRPGQMDEVPSRRAIYRYFRDTGGVGIDTLFLNLADHLATRGPLLILEEWRRHCRTVRHVLESLEEQSVVMPSKLVSGHDLINIFGMSPGPKIGHLLEMVREAQAAGEIAAREEALAFLERRIGEGL